MRRVKRTALISEKLMQVEMKCNKSIEGENRENANNRSGLGGRNTIVGAFVTAAARDLMYSPYLSKLQPDQLLYTDMDSVIVYLDKRNPSHVKLPTSDMLGELKDEYTDVLSENPSWYVYKFMAFGPKMYQLILKYATSGKIIRWDKTMKGISIKGNVDLLSTKSIPLYRNPVIDLCSILQFGSENSYSELAKVHAMMYVLACNRSKKTGKKTRLKQLNVNILFNQNVFKRKLTHMFMNEFIMSISMVKEAKIAKSKRYPKPNTKNAFGVTHPIGWQL